MLTKNENNRDISLKILHYKSRATEILIFYQWEPIKLETYKHEMNKQINILKS